MHFEVTAAVLVSVSYDFFAHAEDVYIAYIFTVYNTYDVSVTHVTSHVN